MVAAFEEFIENGYVATRVEDIAKRLGITKGTIYLYCPNKDVLFESMICHISSPFSELINQVDAQEVSYEKRVSKMLLAYEKIARDRKVREMIRLCLSEGKRFPHIVNILSTEFITPLMHAIKVLVLEGVRLGEFRQGPAADLPDVLVSSVIHLIVTDLLLPGKRPFDEKAFIDAHLDLISHGLSAS
ncbi:MULTISPECIES: TetR/AcrR family transcriptional regulator [Pectobacterium]|nr:MULTISPECIES: TetR/AcrR family transcriptional regulator [Pectobacterium]MBA0173811.1 TetR/AcrR family transcriptional regulator [Pectobacterium versatile]